MEREEGGRRGSEGGRDRELEGEREKGGRERGKEGGRKEGRGEARM